MDAENITNNIHCISQGTAGTVTGGQGGLQNPFPMELGHGPASGLTRTLLRWSNQFTSVNSSFKTVFR